MLKQAGMSFVFLIFSVAACGGGTSGTGGIEITGKAVSITNQPLDNVQVVARNAQGEALAEAVSDAEGTFFLDTLNTRDLVIEATLSGRISDQIGLRVPQNVDDPTLRLTENSNGSFNTQLLQGSSPVPTSRIAISANISLNSSQIVSLPEVPLASEEISRPSTISWGDLNNVAVYSFVLNIVNSNSAENALQFFWFQTGANQVTVQAYVPANLVIYASLPLEVSQNPVAVGRPIVLDFTADGFRKNTTSLLDTDGILEIPWTDGAEKSQISVNLSEVTAFPIHNGSMVTSVKES